MPWCQPEGAGLGLPPPNSPGMSSRGQEPFRDAQFTSYLLVLASPPLSNTPRACPQEGPDFQLRGPLEAAGAAPIPPRTLCLSSRLLPPVPTNPLPALHPPLPASSLSPVISLPEGWMLLCILFPGSTDSSFLSTLIQRSSPGPGEVGFISASSRLHRGGKGAGGASSHSTGGKAEARGTWALLLCQVPRALPWDPPAPCPPLGLPQPSRPLPLPTAQSSSPGS